MNIIVDDKKQIESLVAEEIINCIAQNNKATLGLATGETFINIYRLLVKEYKNGKVDFSNIKTFNLDEYIGIDELNHNSYHFYMKELLFNHINIDCNNTHIPRTSINFDESIGIYNRLLKKHPRDIQLLGIGRNGHIGFNEPDTPFDSKTHKIKLSEESRHDNSRFFSSLSEVPTHAITMGIKNIMNAKKIILIAMGDAKAEIVNDLINGDISEKCPASILKTHPNVTIYLDSKSSNKYRNA
ncbi:glucosamine-6-phosphate deaminase [Mycoplasmatota bacterium WC30]